MENEMRERARGIVKFTELEVEELNIIKEEVFTGKGTDDDKRAKLQRAYKYFGASLPKSYWPIKWDDFIGDADAKKFVMAYCKNLDEALKCGQGLLFYGSHGVGKTTLACLVGKDALTQGFTVKYLPFSKLLDWVMSSFDDTSVKVAMNIVLERVEVLILDDIGKEYDGVRKQLNPMVRLRLDSVLRERLNRNRVTIISTNYNLQELNKQYGESVISILYGACKMLAVKGEDYRKGGIGREFWDKVSKNA